MTMHYLYSLPPQWGYVRGSAEAMGTEGRKVDGVEYTSTTQRDPEWQRFYRRQAARHQRREAALHIAEHIEAMPPADELDVRKYADEAALWQAQRAASDLDELYSWSETRARRRELFLERDRLEFHIEELEARLEFMDRRLADLAELSDFEQRVQLGACQKCGRWDC